MKKKKNTPRNYSQYKLLAIILILVIAGAIAWFVMQELSKPNPMAYADEQHALHEQAYREARELWDAQELTNYRYTLIYVGGTSTDDCTAFVEVHNGTVTLDAPPEPCDFGYWGSVDGWTIENNFDEIEADLSSKQCGFNGCICDGYFVPIVEYDTTLGYPVTSYTGLTMNQIPEGQTCTRIDGGGYFPYIIQDLEPLPDE